MRPMEPETRIDCAGEARSNLLTDRRTSPISTHSHDSIRVLRQKNIVKCSAGSGTKNDCAGEGQQ
jgi:hypothetical protein